MTVSLHPDVRFVGRKTAVLLRIATPTWTTEGEMAAALVAFLERRLAGTSVQALFEEDGTIDVRVSYIAARPTNVCGGIELGMHITTSKATSALGTPRAIARALLESAPQKDGIVVEAF